MMEANEMIGILRNRRILVTLLSIVLILGALGSSRVEAQQRYSRHHQQRPQHSRAKGALIGGAVGLIGGALLGGGKGALIGAGAGAGTGYLIQRRRNHRRHRPYYRRH